METVVNQFSCRFTCGKISTEDEESRSSEAEMEQMCMYVCTGGKGETRKR